MPSASTTGAWCGICIGEKSYPLRMSWSCPQLTEVSTNDPVIQITPEEYPVHGGLRYKEYCLKAAFADGTRELVYQYCGYDVEQTEDGEELILHLKDEHYEFYMDLHYKLHPRYDLMERSVEVRNQTADPVQIERIHSAQFHIPYENLTFSNVHGHWGAEQQRFVQKVSYGKIVIENRRGISSHNHNPYFVLDRDATETSGEVYFGALRLSGNFSGVVEQTAYGETLVQMGLNPHDCLLELQPGESFTAPAILCGYTDQGFETMSHNLHRFALEHIMRKGLRPVLYNSWEATEFHVNSRDQIRLAQKAAELGAELFVLDDGWFGERHSTENGLGDWYVNEGKFPNGLEELIDAVKEQGMLFGIWVEPEMVNPRARLYQDHPDWIYHYETRVSDTSRVQYVLNVTKPEVREFIYDMLDNLLTRYDIDYIKWDANRPISQTGPQRDIWYKHIQTIYEIVTELKKKHPDVLRLRRRANRLWYPGHFRRLLDQRQYRCLRPAVYPGRLLPDLSHQGYAGLGHRLSELPLGTGDSAYVPVSQRHDGLPGRGLQHPEIHAGRGGAVPENDRPVQGNSPHHSGGGLLPPGKSLCQSVFPLSVSKGGPGCDLRLPAPEQGGPPGHYRPAAGAERGCHVHSAHLQGGYYQERRLSNASRTAAASERRLRQRCGAV